MRDLIERLEKAEGYDFTEAVRETMRHAYDRGWIAIETYRRASELCNVAAHLDAALLLVGDNAFLFTLEWDDEPVAFPISAQIMLPARKHNIARDHALARPLAAERGGWKVALARATMIAALKAHGVKDGQHTKDGENG